MKKLNKKSLNVILALLIASNVGGCGVFNGVEKEEEEKKVNKKKVDNRKDDVEKEKSKTNINKKNEGAKKEIVDKEGIEGEEQKESKKNKVVAQANFTKLRELLISYKKMDTTGYTAKSIQVFERAMQSSEKVLNILTTTQSSVDEEVQKLKKAKEQLTRKANFEQLSILIEEINALEETSFTPNSMKHLKNVISLAKIVLNDENATQKEVDDEVENILKAKQSLISRADFIQLQNIVDRTKEVEETKYTEESLLPLYETLKEAEKVLHNLNASQKMVDTVKAKLEEKFNALVDYVAPDMSTLTNLIAQAKEYKENEYSIDSYTSLKQAINQAGKTLNIVKVTSSQVLKAEQALQKAIDTLGVDVTSLQAMLEKVKALDEKLYTPSSYQKVKDAKNKTELFLSTTHKQFEVDAQEKILMDSVKQLIKRADKKDLQKAINDAKATYAGDYTAETMNALKLIVDEAKLVFNNLEATQDEVANATKKVNYAITQLKVVIHKEELQEIINKAKGVKEEEFTPISYVVFKQDYDIANIINNNENATQKQVDDCTSKLETSFNNLLKRADIELLNQKLVDADAINQDNYTDASLITFNAELIKAKELVKDLNVTQEKVDAQLNSLTNAMDKLVVYNAPDLDEIKQAITDAEGVRASDWSSVSYVAMKDTLDVAKEMINKKKVTQAEIDEAKNELLASYKALSVDLSILSNTLTDAKIYQEINYTLDSYSVLQDAIIHTEDFLKVSHTQSEVNAELTSLQTAVDQLVIFEEEDKTALTNAIVEAKKIVVDEYTPDSCLPFSTAITRAEEVKSDYRATSNEISTATNELDSTKANLVKRAITTALKEVITEAKTHYEGQFTTSSLEALKVAVTEAEATLNNANASQNEVNTKTQNIKTAISNLVKLGDKAALANMIAELDALQESEYTPVSWASASLGSVLADAITIRDKTEATNDEVNLALDSLTQAKDKLVKKADITELSNEIAKAQSELSKGYTTVSKEALNVAIAKAQEVTNNPNATALEVSSTLSNLRSAIAGLKVDVTPLSNEINTTKKVDTTNKLPSTISALQKTINDAEAYLGLSNITFDGMNEQIQKLKDAVNGLVDKTDTTALEAKLSEAKILSKDDYTSESYGKLSIIIDEVEQALLNENITSDQVTQLVSKLDTAIKELKKVETVASKRKECEQLIAQGHELLNDFMIQAPESYGKDLADKLSDSESALASFLDEDFTIAEIQGYMDKITVAMHAYKDNAYDMEALIRKCQAKIAEVRAMDLSGYPENAVLSVNHYAKILEEAIADQQSYIYIESAYGWLLEEIDKLTADVDTTVYVNEEAPGEVLALLNAERAKLGLGQLTMDAKLCEATTIRATEAKDQTGLFLDWAHKRPDGREWHTVLDEINYHQSHAGENAASAYASGAALYNGWLGSEGHRKNMLTPTFTKVGISMIKVGNGQWISYMILAV